MNMLKYICDPENIVNNNTRILLTVKKHGFQLSQ